jgi:hypothetical protein
MGSSVGDHRGQHDYYYSAAGQHDYYYSAAGQHDYYYSAAGHYDDSAALAGGCYSDRRRSRPHLRCLARWFAEVLGQRKLRTTWTRQYRNAQR